MGSHRAQEETEAEPLAIPGALLVVISMICVTVVIAAMIVAGNSHDAGGVACAAIMCGAVVAVVRIRRSK